MHRSPSYHKDGRKRHPVRRKCARSGLRSVLAVTTKADFTQEEWDLVRAGPLAAGMMVITASQGGMMRESFEMAKVYGDARKQHGESQLLDELVSTKPERDHTRYHSFEELREHTLQLLRDSA